MQTYARQLAINLAVSEHPHPPRRVFDPSPLPSRVLCVTGQQAPFAILISVPLPAHTSTGLSTSGPGPSRTGYAKVSLRERGLDPTPEYTVLREPARWPE